MTQRSLRIGAANGASGAQQPDAPTEALRGLSRGLKGSLINLAICAMTDRLNDQKLYAKTRLEQTGRHYLVTDSGHVLVDCRNNRLVVKNIESSVVWTTRQPLA